ncbi:JAB domain-containing protein [Novosphingobium panipatense]|nr:DNA repair protein RadC [Novosphingobium panipatense]
MELAGADRPDRRDMASSGPTEAPGCRRALEELIGLTRPDRARELSDRLFTRFGSLGGALAACPAERIELLDHAMDVERTFRCFQRVLKQMLWSALIRRPILSSDQTLHDYLRGNMAYERVEHFRVLFLNAGNELIADEVMGIGSVSGVQVWPREILKRCLDLNATAILLAHNHPSGSPAPSRADRDLTEKIANAARFFGIVVHDHLVVARRGIVSFREAGWLK